VTVPRNRRTFSPLVLLALGASGLWPGLAAANGAFPAVSQLLADPADETHLVLRSNFGLLTTHDRGRNWDWVCEAGLGYQNIEPALAVLGDGTIIVALPNGIARGATECSFEHARGLSAYVADVARVPNAPERAVAVSVDIDRGVSQVWSSRDSGQSWQPWGTPLEELNAATLDVAGDERGTLYVSGVSQNETVEGVLARSTDGGQTWTRSNVPGVSKVSAPYIAALAAEDPQTLYVRLSGSPGRLLVTHDGGAHFLPVLDFEGPVDGFALSPDGRYALASSRVDGVWRASTTALVFERLSCQKLRCLSWTSSGLFACADEFQAGFLVGESRSEGLKFEPRLLMSCVRGPLACDRESPVARACDAGWPAQSEQLGTDCTSTGFTPANECASGGNSGGSAIAGASGLAAAGSPVGGMSARLSAGGGCSLSVPGSTRARWEFSLAVLVWAAARRARVARPRRVAAP